MDDAAILREIARRIRDGMDAAAPAQPEHNPEPPTDIVREQQSLTRLAHELRTPISAMVAAARMMAEQRLGPLEHPQYLSYAENIAASGQHALAIVDRVLESWQQPAEPLPLAFSQLDLNALITRVVSALQPLARERGQTIVTRLEAGLPNLIADATNLRQILLNLLTNATKYAAPDSEIDIVTRSVLDGPLILQIADSGPGMSPGEVAQALGGPGAASTARGTGLGLPLVRSLAAANGADFAIESAPGAPTRITLSFAKDKVVPV